MSNASTIYSNLIETQARAAIAHERAVIEANRPVTEKLRQKRADHEEQRFLADRNREYWQ